MKYPNEQRDSDGFIASFRKGMIVRVISTNEIGTVERQHLVLSEGETYWGNVEVTLRDGSLKTFNHHQLIRVLPSP